MTTQEETTGSSPAGISRWHRWRKEIDLVVCVLLLYTSYFFYGVVQERIFKRDYDGEHFKAPLYMVLVQCTVNSLFAKLITLLGLGSTSSPTAEKPQTPQHKFAICAFAVVSSMVLSNASIQFISYPLQVLAKSCKMIPVMLIGRSILNRAYSPLQYLRVFLLTTGVILFSTANIDGGLRFDTLGSNVPLGLALVVAALLFDGVGGPYAERTCKEHGTTSYELMLYQNLWSLPIVLFGFVVFGELGYAIEFTQKHPRIIVDLLIFSVSSAFGQTFVFYILRNYSALVCTAVTTTRKFFTVLVSIIFFSHALVAQQWLSVFLVFGGILWEAMDHVRSKQSEIQNEKV